MTPTPQDTTDARLAALGDSNAPYVQTFDTQTHCVVPVEPTEAMIKAGNQADMDLYASHCEFTDFEEMKTIYRAMLAARPPAPASETQDTKEKPE
jgi:hypothetical protein